MGNVAVVLGALAGTTHTDGQLLARFAAARDEAAFAELVRRHGPMLLAACRRVLGPGQDADDAFQAAFLVLARRAGAVRDTRSLGAWLHGVARHIALRQRDRERRRRKHEAQAVPLARGPADPGARAAVDDELGRLPDRLRLPLIACILEDRSQEEVARALGISLSTVRRRLDRGLEILRRRMGGRPVVLAGLGGASVSPVFAAKTARQAAAFASCESAAGAALAQGVLNVMLWAKIKTAAVVVVTAVGVVWGVGLVAARQPGGTRPRVAEKTDPPKGEPAKTGARPPIEPDGKLAQMERELTRLEMELDALRNRQWAGDYPVTDADVARFVDRTPAVAALLARREKMQATLAEVQRVYVAGAPAVVARQTELVHTEREVETARDRARPDAVEAAREIAKERLEHRIAFLVAQVGELRAARDARLVELSRVRGPRDPAASSPAGADDRLDQVLKELRELREEVRQLKNAR